MNKYKQIIEKNNNICLKILYYLNFNDRYNFCLVNNYFFKEIFKKINHIDIIKIDKKDINKVKEWKNINFLVDYSLSNIVNVSILKNCHTVNLSSCDNLVDVSALKNVKNLILFNCRNITDV